LPEHSWTNFFWFNAGYFVIMIASVVLYDFLGGKWVILPSAWVERACNGVGHLGWAIHFREYSPGLVSSILMLMNLYFILRYRPATESLDKHGMVPAMIIGLAATAFLVFYIPLFKGRRRRGVSARAVWHAPDGAGMPESRDLHAGVQ
jgi:hypothetical protein